MIILGIDPGKTGAISISYGDDKYEVNDMPQTEKDMYQLFYDIKDNAVIRNESIMAYIEKVQCFSGQGIKSAWTFSGNYHCLRMSLVSNRIPFDTVAPKAWQKTIGLHYPKGINSTQKKKMGRAKAQELFPELAFATRHADSLLIMRYGQLVPF